MQQPFAIDQALARVARAIQPYRKAALFELADEGFNSPFEQLLACMISIRTRDEVTVPCARRLFAQARTPAEVAALGAAAIAAAIADCTFYDAKAKQMQAIAERVVADYQCELPCDDTVLQSFRGVGPKCANLVLGIACGRPRIGVDIHVHRVTNRWGYVRASTPERTLAALASKLPERYWIDLNRLLMPFGKHVCTGTRPRCSNCPVAPMCQQIGVSDRR